MDSEKITVKYFVENEFCKEPYQASEDVAGYDLLAAESLLLFPEKNGCILFLICVCWVIQNVRQMALFNWRCWCCYKSYKTT